MYQQYEYLKQQWASTHPEATPAQYQKAIQQIARKLGI